MVTRQALLSVFGLTLFLLTRTNSLQWGTKQAISNSWPLNTTKPAAVVEDCYEASNARGDAATAATTIRAGGLDGRDRRNRAAFPEETSWIQEFCRTPGNEFFAEVGMIVGRPSVVRLSRSYPTYSTKPIHFISQVHYQYEYYL